MELKTIAEVYAVNNKIGERFRDFANSISEVEADRKIEGETWTLAALVEHVAIVESGIAQICRRMIDGAREAGTPSDGSYRNSDGFNAKLVELEGSKFVAPERVAPTGGVSIAESLARLNNSTAAIAEMQADLEAFDVSGFTFPHPYFGPLNAAEWVLLSGGHAARHMAQAQKMLEKIR